MTAGPETIQRGRAFVRTGISEITDKQRATEGASSTMRSSLGSRPWMTATMTTSGAWRRRPRTADSRRSS